MTVILHVEPRGEINAWKLRTSRVHNIAKGNRYWLGESRDYRQGLRGLQENVLL